ncbi:uncharacterized protein LTR77_006929 [Saxophila tyrrhenica]|uniref:ASST-domain-containing protein n=1 Tax=Saxophila tyrrhenica TaxID=1690608 RepID=A0AAV9P667_9PEZI|nr:hypothetical protein LTR77_006929 [Saxophila tyrrhenica]
MAWSTFSKSAPLLILLLLTSVGTAHSDTAYSLVESRELIGTAEDEADADFPGDKFHTFVSRPDIKAPKFRVNVFDRAALAPGYWFVAPYHELDQDTTAKHWVGPYIFDDSGELVWCGAATFDHYNTFDFRVEQYQGKDVLTLMYPNEDAGAILDNTYSELNRVEMKGVDMHEFNLVDDGVHSLMVTSTEHHSTIEQAAEIGIGPNKTCKSLWKGFRELDTATSEAVFEWDGRDHIGLDEVTFTPTNYEELCQRNWDIMHFNAVDKFPNGDYLVSSRHTDTLYKVNHTDSSIVWRLGGTNSSFSFASKSVKFSRQHHATVRGQNSTHTLVAIFDNAIGSAAVGEVATHSNSRGLLLSLEHETMTASIAAQYDHPQGALTNSRGSFQTLPNGNAFMGWTYHTQISEHTADGRLIMEASLKLPGHCYRSYKFPWVGQPARGPDVYAAVAAAGNETMQTVVYASWNGATEVSTWELYHSDPSGKTIELVASTPRQGFETVLVYDGYAKHVIASALDAHGAELGRSSVIEATTPEEGFDGFSAPVVAEAQWLEEQSHPTTEPEHEHEAVEVVGWSWAAYAAGAVSSLVAVAASWGAWRAIQKMVGRRKGEGEMGVYEPLNQMAEADGSRGLGRSREEL